MAPILVETEEEKRLFKKGEENYQAKKALRTRSLLEKAPDDEESNLIHSMWTKEMSYLSTYLAELRSTNLTNPDPQSPPTRPENQVFMSDTVLKSAMIMQPKTATDTTS